MNDLWAPATFILARSAQAFGHVRLPADCADAANAAGHIGSPSQKSAASFCPPRLGVVSLAPGA
ncbi:MAG: hypothetical protein BGN91_15540 [Nitrobacter sp. 62-13]|nr:MAG: hypothetical protein BGN91_15540 [Nitrobacter sp. 62-13]